MPLSRPHSRARSHRAQAGAESRSRSRSPLGAQPPGLQHADAPLPTLRGDGWRRAGATWHGGGEAASRRVSLSLSTSSEVESSGGAPQWVSHRPVSSLSNEEMWDAVRRAESAGASTSGAHAASRPWFAAPPYAEQSQERAGAHGGSVAAAAASLAPASAFAPPAGAARGVGVPGEPRRRPPPRRPAVLYDLSLPLTPNVAATLAVPTADTAGAAAALLGGSRGDPFAPRAEQLGPPSRPVAPPGCDGLRARAAPQQQGADAPTTAGSQLSGEKPPAWQHKAAHRWQENVPAAARPPRAPSPLPPAPQPLSPRSAQAAGLLASELLGERF